MSIRRLSPGSSVVAAVLLTGLVAACAPGAEVETPTSTTQLSPTTTAATTTTTVAPSEPVETTTKTSTLVIDAPEPAPVVPPEGYELVWSDEFDGAMIDPANWTYDIGGWGWGNGEAQYYTDRAENARLQDGVLVIEAHFEKFEGAYYTSARLKTEGLREFQYGYIEARAKVPAGAGLWPAFWMLGATFERDESNPIDSNWPHAGEIDIMEYVGREPNITYGTIHGPGYAGAGSLGKWNRQETPIAEGWHTYAVEWDYDGIRWFYDGEMYGELGRDAVGEREWVFDQPFFLLLNLALGGTFPGPIGLDVEFPKQFLVDHVRVYQRVDESGG
ncbi:MAG: glycoside hydrolase family 16 protein [Acidimicrobiia bacterium]|nr:glycoside hydrolase family 16 protein [Acidimicrobiia bacterium]